jgi:hypothetical protein
VQSTIPTLPRPVDPDWRPGPDDDVRAAAGHALKMAIVGAVAHLDGPERSAVLADALAWLQLDTLSWCERCQRSLPEGFCFDHIGAYALVEALRRDLYSRLPGRPLVEADL